MADVETIERDDVKIVQIPMPRRMVEAADAKAKGAYLTRAAYLRQILARAIEV